MIERKNQIKEYTGEFMEGELQKDEEKNEDE